MSVGPKTFVTHDDNTAAGNRQDFSHCNANVKSRLDEVLRRGSVSVEAELGLWVVAKCG